MTTLAEKEGQAQTQGRAQTQSNVRPAYTVREEAEHFLVRVVLPGVPRNGVEINLEGDLLTIRGNRVNTTPHGWRPLRRETSDAQYALGLRLNVEVDSDKISAKVEDGILNLSLPKAEQIRPRTIGIK
jgi:HSP20 family protein